VKSVALGIVILLAGVAAACSGDDGTLLQIDVKYDQALTFAQLRFSIGDNQTRTWRVPSTDGGATDSGADAEGEGGDAGYLLIGVDMRLPSSLAGLQTVTVRALDEAECLLASGTFEVVLHAGERVQGGVVSLVTRNAPDCGWQGDAGAERS
jgi:hypothetical protein